MAEKKIYILLTDTGTLFTKLIKLYTKKPFNHASISFDQSLSNVYSFGRTSPSNPFTGGFVKEDMDSCFFKQANCKIYSCPVSTAQYQKMHSYIQKINEEKCLYRYNLLGLFALLLKKRVDRKYAFFCSQFVATVLQESECVDFSKPLSLITPNDLIKENVFEFVYEGNLGDYYVGLCTHSTTDLAYMASI